MLDYDNDQRYATPRAWRNVKRALGKQNYVDKLLEAVEQVARRTGAGMEELRYPWNCPRLMLAIALHHFAAAGPEQRAQMEDDYWAWCQWHTDWQLNRTWEKHDSGIPCPRADRPTPPPPLVEPPPAPVETVMIGGVIYLVVIVPGYPRKNGEPFKCIFDPMTKRVELSEHVPASDRTRLLTEMAAWAERRDRDGLLHEALPDAERDAATPDFEAAMVKLFGDDWRRAA